MMNITKRYLPHIRPIILLCCCGILLQSCTTPRLLAVIKTKKSSSGWKGKVKVYIRFSSKSLFENRMAVINASTTTMSIYPVDVTLEIPDAGIILPAVIDFHEYVGMRSEEATKQCAESDRPERCSRYIKRFFDHYSSARVFNFGEIPPKKKRNGYFAFNLPDPFNPTAQSKEARKRLKNSGRLLNGTIRIIVRTIAFEPRELEFTFPVKVIVSKDEKPKLLRMMKYF